MKHVTWFFSLVALSLSPSWVSAQFRANSLAVEEQFDARELRDSADELSPASSGMPVILERGGQDAISGHLLKIGSDSVEIWSSGACIVVARSDLRSITVLRSGRIPVVAGALFGGYVADFAMQERGPGYFVQGMDAQYAGEFCGLGAACGALLSLLFSTSDHDVVFDLEDSAASHRAWNDLRNYVDAGITKDHITLEFTTGWVSSPVTGKYETDNTVPRKSFTSLRRGAIYVPATTELSIGLGYVSSAEPGHTYVNVFHPSTDTYWPSYTSSDWKPVWFTADNFLGLVRYSRALSESETEFQLHVDLGIGYGTYDFSSTMPDSTSSQFHLANAVGVFYGAVGIDWRVNNELSLGLTADYLVGPSEMLPTAAFPHAATEKVMMGNGSLSITLGFHI